MGLALAPHAAVWCRHGTFQYLADTDDAFYLAISRAPYHGEWTIRDPYASAEERVPVLYTWPQFVPSAKLTALVGLPPLAQAVVWRLAGGAILAASLYALFRGLFVDLPSPGRWAVVCTLIVLADSGTIDGRSILGNFLLVPHLLAGTTPATTAKALGQYRIVNPLTNLWVLLLFSACLLPHVLGKRAGLVAGVAALAGAVWTFFFYWTTAVLALALVTGVWAVRAAFGGGRTAWQRALCGTTIAILGLGIGAPLVWSNWRTSQDPSLRPVLDRQERGAPVPIEDFGRRTRYLWNTWMWAKLVLAGAVILAIRAYQAAPIWALTLSGFALTCSAVVTGREFDNFHWGALVANPMSEVLVLAICVLAADRFGWRTRAWPAVVGVGMVVLAIAVAWRPYEALAAPEPAHNSAVIAQLQPLRPWLDRLSPSETLAGATDARIAVLYGQAGLLYMAPYTAHACLLSDDEVHQRAALNAWVSGLSRDELIEASDAQPFSVGPPFRVALPGRVAAPSSPGCAPDLVQPVGTGEGGAAPVPI
jgi:hypothetical protein